MATQPRYHAQNRGHEAVERISTSSQEPSASSRVSEATTASGEGQTGGTPSHGDGREVIRHISTDHSHERSKDQPGHGNGGRTFTAMKDGEGIGNMKPQEPALATGDPTCFQGEALQWQRSEYPGGTNMAKGKRGSFAGAIPEALRGEAPKGQPMIHGETLEVVCVEAPEGQPRNHRRHPRQVMRRPMGKA